MTHWQLFFLHVSVWMLTFWSSNRKQETNWSLLSSKQTKTVASSLVESSANSNFSLNSQLHDLEAFSHYRDLGMVCFRFIHLWWETVGPRIQEDICSRAWRQHCLGCWGWQLLKVEQKQTWEPSAGYWVSCDWNKWNAVIMGTKICQGYFRKGGIGRSN